MPIVSRLTNFLQVKKLDGHPLFLVSTMVFFWTIFDGMMSFAAPIVITRAGLTESLMGIILGTSSVAGVFFDLFLCRILKNTNFRRMYLFTFILCVFFPFLLWQAKGVWLFLAAMALWGLYYDFFCLGNFDFISRNTNKESHSANFGVLNVFITLGYLLAPLIAGFFVGEVIAYNLFLAAWIFLATAVIFFIILFLIQKKGQEQIKKEKKVLTKPTSFLKEIRLWKKIGNFILPILSLTFFLNVIDAFYWTTGPLLSERLGMDGERGLFMTTFLLPPLIVGWFIGKITRRLGKKRTAFIALIVGSLILTTFIFIKNPLILIVVNFLASFFISMSFPSINGAYADYISEKPIIEKEIETMEDSFTNLGYIIGPVASGFASQYLGYTESFALLGFFGVIVGVVLLIVTPKKINIKISGNL